MSHESGAWSRVGSRESGVRPEDVLGFRRQDSEKTLATGCSTVMRVFLMKGFPNMILGSTLTSRFADESNYVYISRGTGIRGQVCS